MTDDRRDIGWLDARRFADNRNRVPIEVLLPYLGMHIAWTSDGTTIVAAGKDELDLDRQVREAGIDPRSVVFDFLPAEEAVVL